MKRLCLGLAIILLAGCQAPQPANPLPQAPVQPVAPPPVVPPAPPVVHPAPSSAGPLTKANVETYMDAQERDLRLRLRGQGATVARRGDALAVTVPSDRLFDKGDIGPWGNTFLQVVADVLVRYEHTQVEVVCHTDARGGEAQSLALSEQHAKAVANALAHAGIAAARLTASGRGAGELRVANANDARNRRIEIKIVPNPK